MKKIIIPSLLLLGGIAIFILLVKTKPEAQKNKQTELARLVETISVQRGTVTVRVQGQGEVSAARRVEIIPQVSGAISWQDSQLRPGAIYLKGSALFKIDSRDYILALAQQQAGVERARLEWELERNRGRVAGKEWRILEANKRLSKKGESVDGNALALRGPQLKAAEVNLSSAESALKRAELILSRTTISAPFNGIVQSEQVELGQVVGPQSRLLSLVGTDQFWVQISVPVSELQWILFPKNGVSGAKVLVSQSIGSRVSTHRGEVIGRLGEVDRMGKMARVIVAINDPLMLKHHSQKTTHRSDDIADEYNKNQTKQPLLLGSYVEVEIIGRQIDDTITVDRRALRGKNELYIKTSDNRLEMRHVDIIRKLTDTIWIRGGVAEKERVIVSRVSRPIPRMLLRENSANSAKSAKSTNGKGNHLSATDKVMNNQEQAKLTREASREASTEGTAGSKL